MPDFSPESLADVIAAHFADHEPRQFCLALSGGLDSVALLHAMAALRGAQAGWSLRAVHIDHQLQPASGEWAERCVQAATSLDVPCLVQPVQVVEGGQGPESAARRARYRAFADCLGEGEILLTAHHADDQLETLLIALVRGAGATGLASMPRCAPFARGWHLRPLLDFTRRDLEQWAGTQRLRFTEDPSNRDTRFDRNFLRHEIIPLLKSRWPAVASTMSRTARHLAEADQLLEQLAANDLRQVSAGECLVVSRLRELEPARRRLVLRHWIRQRGLLLPSTRALAALEHDMLQAADDRVPCVRWQGAEAHRHRGLLHVIPALPDRAQSSYQWDRRERLVLGALGELHMTPAPGGLAVERLPVTLSIRFRTGGERIQLAGEAHRRQLKKLMQASQVPPWWRDRLPLVYAGEQLIAVADLWIDERFAARENEAAARVVWNRPPALT